MVLIFGKFSKRSGKITNRFFLRSSDFRGIRSCLAPFWLIRHSLFVPATFLEKKNAFWNAFRYSLRRDNILSKGHKSLIQAYFKLKRGSDLNQSMQGPREHGVSGVSWPPWLFENAIKSDFSGLRGKFLKDLRSLTPLALGPRGVPESMKHILAIKISRYTRLAPCLLANFFGCNWLNYDTKNHKKMRNARNSLWPSDSNIFFQGNL